jgi:dihydrofolate reductase
MARVSFDLSMSLDGFIAGPNAGPGNGLGDGGDALHQWAYDLSSFHERHGRTGGESNADSELLEEAMSAAGALLMGRNMFDHAVDAWGADPPFRIPVFVLTSRPQDPIMRGDTTFTFVSDGIEPALERARAAAGDAEVGIAGGAQVAQQYLRAGLVDEFQIHLVPVLLSAGVRLFDGIDPATLQVDRLVESPTGVTHLRYRVLK